MKRVEGVERVALRQAQCDITEKLKDKEIKML